ncbi:hypothetical protein RO3G_09876 [Rhizopus delemar RA 99-880]|uniref:GRIP domain-containing protein n=1 Tax=Rhizopus delemar (strain RA 99-880 / ATCC MYA-4621 / FGSC 9543 / NRRL 43880) TaxID=246409 RepID=I1C9N6_RHIO9|nr:hypothetical protein RO3G_09876 [Rhizopus delemar RA 99-880]|eukprot:EIE85166.1 hypothetical protein RO3G_09876 [Rhizopus delemar RA 99-880]
MSTVNQEVESLKKRLEKYEKDERKWKEEHTQLLDLQKKITQAGSHMRTLANEISTLSKAVADEKQQKEQLNIEWQKKQSDTEKDHQEKLKQLIDIVESGLDEKQQPDTSGSLETYLQSLQERLSKKAANNDTSPQKLQEQLRGNLNELQGTVNKNQSDTDEIRKDLNRQITQLKMTNNELSEEKEKLTLEKEELEGQVESLEKDILETKSKLEESEEKRSLLNKEHQSLLGKLSHIKETLIPRLEQDKQLREKINELTHELETTSELLEERESQLGLLEQEYADEKERAEREIESITKQLEETQRKCEEYEAVAMDLDVQCSEVQEQLQKTQTELEALKMKTAAEQVERESERTSLANLQTVLEEFQATKDAEMQAAIDHVQRQLDVAKKAWKEYEERAHTAEGALEKYKNGVEKAERYEKEVKEKNLLIGKLRHEAIILNEHLVEAMRKLKEETRFLNTPRGDRKKYDILTIISNVLHLSEEEKEQIGLSRPKQSLGSPPITIEQPAAESFTDAWISFLLKESNPLRRNRSAVTLSNTENQIDL